MRILLKQLFNIQIVISWNRVLLDLENLELWGVKRVQFILVLKKIPMFNDSHKWIIKMTHRNDLKYIYSYEYSLISCLWVKICPKASKSIPYLHSRFASFRFPKILIASNPNLKPPFGIPRFRFDSFWVSWTVIIAARNWTKMSAKYFMPDNRSRFFYLGSSLECQASSGEIILCSIAIQNDITTEGCVSPIVVLSLLPSEIRTMWLLERHTVGHAPHFTNLVSNFQCFFFGK